MLQHKKIKRTLSAKVRCLLTIRYVPFVGFYGESRQNYREQAGLSKFSVFGDVVKIRITEDSPEIKVLREKDLVVWQDCPQESV